MQGDTSNARNMNDVGTFNLFRDNGQDVAMPIIPQEALEKQQSLVTESVISKLEQPVIKTLYLKEETKIASMNYVFDFSEMQSLSVLKRTVLKSLIDNVNGDTTLYLYGKQGLCEIGRGERYNLAKIIPLIKTAIFGDTVKIYKDFRQGEEMQEIKGRDITKLRLNL